MKVGDIIGHIEKIAPPGLAQSWDNVGLLTGDENAAVKKMLLAIDVTRDVAAEAKKLGTELIVSYHPVIWDGLKKITARGPGEVVYRIIQSGISVYSIHTALDAAVGGVNDGLAEMVGIKDGRPIGDYVQSPEGDNYKLVVFVPPDSLAKVSDTVFAAGAGVIGNYSNCSFQLQGTGTFLPLEGARPAIGRKGKLENVTEARFEAVVPGRKLTQVIAAMSKAHPYETPAFDVFKLHDTADFGLGRIGPLEKPAQIEQIIRRIRRYTGARAIGIIGPKKRLVRYAAVCAGACGKIINQVIAAKAELYVTGELKHHQAIAAQEAGLTCICLSHTVSERFILKKLAALLQKQLDGVTIRISKKDADPFEWRKL